jgi:dTDP-4-dehydrorhamnose 3,5-epimerase-like enzyme
MPELISLRTFTDDRGYLTVIEKILPFEIKRIFYIYGVDNSVRGGHRHRKTVQAAICLHGSCSIYCNDSKSIFTYKLLYPYQCLMLFPNDWHSMFNFSNDAILMVLASEYFDPNDYIYEPYN